MIFNSDWSYRYFFSYTDSKGKRPLFCQFVPPLSEEKEPFKKKPLVSWVFNNLVEIGKIGFDSVKTHNQELTHFRAKWKYF